MIPHGSKLGLNPTANQGRHLPSDHPFALLLVFVAFWYGGAVVMSRIAGWHEISSLYPAPQRLHGEELRFCTASLGTESFPLTYRRCLRVLLTDQGLGLCLMLPFRFHSPAFLVPWQAVSSCTETQALFTRKVVFSFHGTNRRVVFAGPLGQFVKSKYLAHTCS